jgi:hypothetical protein
VNENQLIDHAYHEEKLLRLVPRGKLQAVSDETEKLDIETRAVRDLVRSYRIVKRLESDVALAAKATVERVI